MIRRPLIAVLWTSLAVAAQEVAPAEPAQDWPGFRGGVRDASHGGAVATEWDAKRHIAWRLELPGPGTSSPIVVGDGVFVTCWSGYGLDREKPGNPRDLRRHLLRVDRDTGVVVWQREVLSVDKEDPFAGRMAIHGYASNTPVSDGERIYAFFGKAGVFAFDLDGRLLWRTGVGDGSSRWLTGSGSSLALWRDLLFVNACDESLALWALDKDSGGKVWQRGGGEEFDQAYGTPIVARPDGPAPELLFGILGRVEGLDPRTGKPRWSVTTKTNGALAPSILVGGDTAYSFGGQSGDKSHAIRLGGTGDVTGTHVAWISRYGSYVITPLLHEGHLYWVNEGGIVYCAAAATGELVYRERLEGAFYASPVRAGGAIYYVSRESGTFVVAAGPKFELLAQNRIDSDAGAFDATPAISGDRLFLRSRRALYCIR